MGTSEDLLGLSRYISDRTLKRLEGLTDEEFRWQPVPGAWTVRQLGDGRAVLDNNYWPVDVPPLTSLAWRIGHLIEVYGARRNALWVGAQPRAEAPVDGPWLIAFTAEESVALLRQAIDWFNGLLAGIDDATYSRKIGPIGGPYADSSIASFVLHQIDEAIHHGAEVGILRDLYEARGAGSYPDPTLADLQADPNGVSRAADLGRWDLVEQLAVAGADVNATATGRTALHQAAGVGDLAIVRLLVEHGGDPSIEDRDFHATPLGWAAHFGRRGVAEYLTSLS